MERVRWFRTRAALERRQEELEILDEEFRRTHLSFTKMNTIWKRIGERQFLLRKVDHRLASGYKAFACRQAAMYAKLANATADNWKTARSYAPVLN